MTKNFLVYIAFLFYLTGCGESGGDSDIGLQAPPDLKGPSVVLNSNFSEVNYNGSITLNWSTREVNSCVASGDWSGNKGTAGSEVINALTVDSSFILTCTGINGLVGDALIISVVGPVLPTLSLIANPGTVLINGSTTLTWNTTDATSCMASGDWTGTRAASGSETISSLSVDSSFVLSCSGEGGNSISDSVSVTVGTPSAPSISLSVSSSSVPYNSPVTLSWSSNGSSCTASGDWSGTKDTSGSQTINALTANSSFNLSCSGVGGTASDSVSVSVDAPPAPTVDLSASLTNVAYNGSTILNWTSTNADSCTASGNWSGNRNTSGSSTRNSLTADRTYILTCSGAGGTAIDLVSITVDDPVVQPTVSLSASPTTVTSGGSTTLSWSSTDADSCTASGDWSGNKASSGSQSISSLTANSTFNLSCSGTGGTGSDSVSVSVDDPVVQPTVSLSASPTTVTSGGSTTLSWSSTGADSCTASGDWSGNKASSGSQSISSLTANSTFNLSCSGTGGTGSDSVSVSVDDPVVQPTVSLSASPTTVTSGGSTTLSWSSTDADSCTASGDWSGNKASSGSQSISSLTANSTFNLSCSGTGGTGSDSVSVSVDDPVVQPTVSLSASPTTVTSGGSTTLSWSSTDADSCTASGDWSGNKSLSGSETINSIVSNSQFTLDCSGAGGSVNDTVNITVVTNNNGTALLSWLPPTENTDGSNLDDLTGYKIYYGTATGSYGTPIVINDAGLSSYLVENLAPSDWYFVMTSFNASGIESAYSTEVSKSIN